MLGLLPDYRLRVPSAFPGPGLAVYLVGETAAELGGSEFAEAVLGEVTGMPPALDVAKERALLDLLVAAAAEALLASAHDCGDGGAGRGPRRVRDRGGPRVRGVDPDRSAAARRAVQRVGVARGRERRAARRGRVPALAAAHGVPVARIGETGGPRAVIDAAIDIPVAELAEIWETAIPRLLGEAV